MDGGVLVLGLGNVLMGDDAFGPTVVRRLESAYRIPSGVRVLDAGTPGLDLTFLVQGAHALIAVDAIDAPGAPGELRFYTKEEILDRPLPRVVTPHEPTFRESLMRLEFAGGAPRRVLVLGAIPAQLGTGQPMSASVQRAVEPALEAIARELADLGLPLHHRLGERAIPPWWEARDVRERAR